jgi:hypothetical protein
METKQYNPSHLEIEFAHALTQLKKELESYLTDNNIVSIRSDEQADNPAVHFHLKDKDGDQHELVVRIIQRVDGHTEHSSA